MTVIWSRSNSNNAAESVQQVRKALGEAERQAAGPRASALFMGDAYLAEQVAALRSDWPVDVMRMRPTRSGLLGRVLGLGQQLLRRATWWYMLPQWEQVTNFHATSVRVIDSLLAGMAYTRERVGIMEDQLSIAYERQRYLMEQVARLTADLEALKAAAKAKD